MSAVCSRDPRTWQLENSPLSNGDFSEFSEGVWLDVLTVGGHGNPRNSKFIPFLEKTSCLHLIYILFTSNLHLIYILFTSYLLFQMVMNSYEFIFTNPGFYDSLEGDITGGGPTQIKTYNKLYNDVAFRKSLRFGQSRIQYCSKFQNAFE